MKIILILTRRHLDIFIHYLIFKICFCFSLSIYLIKLKDFHYDTILQSISDSQQQMELINDDVAHSSPHPYSKGR